MQGDTVGGKRGNVEVGGVAASTAATAKILIVTGDAAESLEVLYPYQRLREEGYDVHIAAPARKTLRFVVHDFEEGFDTYTEKPGYTWPADLAFSEVDPGQYAALVIPGGRAPEYLRNDAELRKILKAFFDTDKPVAQICHGPLLTAAVGGLSGRRVTAYPALELDMQAAGATLPGHGGRGRRHAGVVAGLAGPLRRGCGSSWRCCGRRRRLCEDARRDGRLRRQYLISVSRYLSADTRQLIPVSRQLSSATRRLSAAASASASDGLLQGVHHRHPGRLQAGPAVRAARCRARPAPRHAPAATASSTASPITTDPCGGTPLQRGEMAHHVLGLAAAGRPGAAVDPDEVAFDAVPRTRGTRCSCGVHAISSDWLRPAELPLRRAAPGRPRPARSRPAAPCSAGGRPRP